MQRMFLNWSNIFSSNSRAEIQDKQHHTNKLDSNAIESEIQEQKSRKTNKGVSSVFLMFCPLYHHLSKWSQNTDKTLYCCLIVFTLDWGILLLKGTPSFYTLGVNYPRQVCWLSLSPENVVWGDRWLCLTSQNNVGEDDHERGVPTFWARNPCHDQKWSQLSKVVSKYRKKVSV